MADQVGNIRLVEPPSEPVDPLVGQTIDSRYVVESRLGEGGMGVVYRAKHAVLGKALAMKVLRADVSRDEEIITRFRQEAQSASAIGSQHIIDISDFGQLADGATYFVMELLQGQELTNLIESSGRIPPERVIHIAAQLCDALGAAHDRGIVHRDMKPDNVFLVKRGGDPDFVKVLDFGIAKVGGANSKLTRAGQVFGTPHYMSPEQCSGQAVDHRTDIYALGVIMYEMAAGSVPFDADNLMGILTKHIYEQPVPLRELPPPVDVPPGLEAIILKCLAKAVEQRYQTMAEVKADLLKLRAGTTPDAVMDAMSREGSAMRRDPTGPMLQVGVGGEPPSAPSKAPMMIGAGIGLVALLGGAAALWFLVLAPEPEPAPVPEPVVQVQPEPDPEPEPEPEPDPEPEPAADEAAAQQPPAVMVTIDSDPSGAEVWSVDGDGNAGVTLGNTPYRIERPTERGERISLLLRKPGFQDQTVVVGRLTATEVSFALRGARPTSSSRRHHAPGAGTTPAAAEPAPTRPTSRGSSSNEVLDPWAGG